MVDVVDAGVRATVFSLRGQAAALAGIVGGPALGAVATLCGTRSAMTAAALPLVPAVLIYARTAHHVQPLVVSVGTEARPL
jgi:ABC-type methionine transport system permease subunit